MHRLFSVREVRQCTMRAHIKHDDEAVHAAARWAGKESVIKAWSQAVGDGVQPYTIDTVPWNLIEILDDSHGRPRIVLADSVNHALSASLCRCEPSAWQVSMSHDGPIASAIVLLGISINPKSR